MFGGTQKELHGVQCNAIAVQHQQDATESVPNRHAEYEPGLHGIV